MAETFLIPQKTMLWAKTEVTPGTDPTPAEADAFEVDDLEWKNEGNTIIRNMVRHAFAAPGSHDGKRMSSVAFKIPFVAFDPTVDTNAVDWTAPKYDRLLKACGMTRTDNITVPSFIDDFDYDFDSNASSSLTFYLIEQDISGNAQYEAMNGARGVWKLTGATDALVMFEFAFSGVYAGVPANKTFTAASLDYGDTYERIGGGVGKGMVLTLGGTSREVKSFTLTPNREVAMRESVLATYGNRPVIVNVPPGANHTLEIDMEFERESTYAAFTKLLAETREALVLQVDVVPGVRLKVTAPKAQISDLQRENDGGLIRAKTTLQLGDNEASVLGDDALKLNISITP